MNKKSYFLTAAIIFAIVSILHLLRSVYQIELIIGSWNAGLWLSWIAFLLAAFMAYQGFKLHKSEEN